MIAADTAYQLSRIENPAERAKWIDKAANGEVTRDEASRIAKQANTTPGTEPKVVAQAKAVLGDFSMTVRGPELVMDTFVSLLEKLLARARKAKAKKVALDMFVLSLRKTTQ
jgi:hypothetical protein